MTGTFLPWVRSGSVERNSYRAVGLLRRFGLLHGAADDLAYAWPFFALTCAVAAAGYLLGLRRSAAGLAALAAAAAAAGAGYALSRSYRIVTVVASGPVVTIIGSGLVLSAATMQFSKRGRP